MGMETTTLSQQASKDSADNQRTPVEKRAWMRLAAAIDQYVSQNRGKRSPIACLLFPRPYAGRRVRGNARGTRQRHLEQNMRLACGLCPVRQMCLEYAATGVDVAGFMAGMTKQERTAQFAPTSDQPAAAARTGPVTLVRSGRRATAAATSGRAA